MFNIKNLLGTLGYGELGGYSVDFQGGPDFTQVCGIWDVYQATRKQDGLKVSIFIFGDDAQQKSG